MIDKKKQPLQKNKGSRNEDRKKEAEKELYRDLNDISFKTSFKRLNTFYQIEEKSKMVS